MMWDLCERWALCDAEVVVNKDRMIKRWFFLGNKDTEVACMTLDD